MLLSFRLTIRNVNILGVAVKLGVDISFRLTIRNVNHKKLEDSMTNPLRFRLTIRNVNLVITMSATTLSLVLD